MTAIVDNRWRDLRRHTAARIALGRAGVSLPTSEVLAFDLAHAQARDAVLTPLDTTALRTTLETDGWSVIEVRSRAPSREAYLARPDWGRRLRTDDAAQLAASPRTGDDIVFVVSDGLSSTAVQRHTAPLLATLRPLLTDLSIAPIVIATQARVALADEVGATLGVRLSVSFIGERPGLSSPDSLGLYTTYNPQIGHNDSERNCISNVRPQGLPYGAAALQLVALIRASLQARVSGVALRFDPKRVLPPI